MIQVRYFGRLGNRLFQYCTGRILAEELGLKLVAPKIPGFPRTQDKVGGEFVGPRRGNPREHWKGFDLEITQVLQNRSPRFIRLDGACSQNFKRDYLPYQDRIREWLIPEPGTPVYPPGDLVVVHVRLKDYERRGYTMSEAYYKKILDELVFGILVVVTDNPKSEYLEMFKQWDALITSTSELLDFKYLRDCKRFVMSASTFSWWAAFLGRQEEVHFPIPRTGYWSPDEFPFIDLTVPGDPRYRYWGEP